MQFGLPFLTCFKIFDAQLNSSTFSKEALAVSCQQSYDKQTIPTPSVAKKDAITFYSTQYKPSPQQELPIRNLFLMYFSPFPLSHQLRHSLYEKPLCFCQIIWHTYHRCPPDWGCDQSNSFAQKFPWTNTRRPHGVLRWCANDFQLHTRPVSVALAAVEVTSFTRFRRCALCNWSQQSFVSDSLSHEPTRR